MKIVLNKRKTELKQYNEITIDKLLEEVRYSFPLIIVKVNNRLIKKENYKAAVVKDGDTVDVIHLVGGG